MTLPYWRLQYISILDFSKPWFLTMNSLIINSSDFTIQLNFNLNLFNNELFKQDLFKHEIFKHEFSNHKLFNSRVEKVCIEVFTRIYWKLQTCNFQDNWKVEGHFNPNLQPWTFQPWTFQHQTFQPQTFQPRTPWLRSLGLKNPGWKVHGWKVRGWKVWGWSLGLKSPGLKCPSTIYKDFWLQASPNGRFHRRCSR